MYICVLLHACHLWPLRDKSAVNGGCMLALNVFDHVLTLDVKCADHDVAKILVSYSVRE